eukprot:TRINITY_DN9955_c0_g2_i2.p1 TRINITY_DN9955_c0_g2~~TRINITY_DN9955_c0_g2_i2.p1  ORF type:complete len:141 (-),score=6.26 TRINITY_DN9955_c0_g2_i2:348-770(-)
MKTYRHCIRAGAICCFLCEHVPCFKAATHQLGCPRMHDTFPQCLVLCSMPSAEGFHRDHHVSKHLYALSALLLVLSSSLKRHSNITPPLQRPGGAERDYGPAARCERVVARYGRAEQRCRTPPYRRREPQAAEVRQQPLP